MSKSNRKAQYKAQFEKMISGKEHKWWHRKGLHAPVKRTSKFTIETRKLRLSLTRKAIKGNASKVWKQLIPEAFKKDKRIPHWQKYEQQIQYGFDVIAKWFPKEKINQE